MNDERVVEDIITEFFLNTCRRRPQFSQHTAEAALACVYIASMDSLPTIPLTTGSVAEFYIESMLPHIGDVDVMHYDTNVLAIPGGHPIPVPSALPDEFFGKLEVYEITDSHLPGYVYLEVRSGGIGGYKSNHLVHDKYRNVHGPAILVPRNETQPGSLSIDVVPCVRCLEWPPQAADWPTRHRNCGWPDSATVDHIVSNGCDVVNVAHRQCRQDKWMRERQWRLSFSCLLYTS